MQNKISRKSTVLMFTLLPLLWCNIGVAQTAAINFDSLKVKIDSIAKKYNVPGAQVVVFTSDSVLFKKNVGVKNLKTKAPVTDETMFRLGSITKSFVAVSALQLIEKGNLKLEDQLKELAPEIQFENPWEATHPIRIVHLLEHTTGFDDWSLREYAFSSDTITLEQGLMLYPESRKSRWRPGSFFAYCNSGPPIVARIIEKKTGQEYESWVRNTIFTPLGMNSITFRNDGKALQHLVTNYSGEKNPKEEKYWNVLRRPAGSLNASALELMPFIQMLMKRGTYDSVKLLEPTSVDRMELPVTTLAAEAGSQEGYGLHNYTTSYKGHVFHGHDGGVNGGLAHYVYNTPLNIGFVVLVNYDGQGFTKLNNAVMEAIMKEVPSAVPSAISLTEEDKAKWTGYYRAAYPRATMTYFLEWLLGIEQVYERGGQLYAKQLMGGEETPLHHARGNLFMNLNKEGYTNTFTFTENDDHKTVMIAGFSNMLKTSAAAAWLPVAIGALTLFITLAGLLAGIIWIIRYFYLRSRARSLSVFPARVSFWAYCISFISMAFIIISNLTSFSLGNPGGASYAVFITSILIPLFTIVAIFFFIRDRRKVSSRLDKIFLYACLGSAVIITGYLGVWGLIGLRTWM